MLEESEQASIDIKITIAAVDDTISKIENAKRSKAEGKTSPSLDDQINIEDVFEEGKRKNQFLFTVGLQLSDVLYIEALIRLSKLIVIISLSECASFKIDESLEPSVNLSRAPSTQFGGEEQNNRVGHKTSSKHLTAQNSSKISLE